MSCYKLNVLINMNVFIMLYWTAYLRNNPLFSYTYGMTENVTKFICAPPKFSD